MILPKNSIVTRKYQRARNIVSYNPTSVKHMPFALKLLEEVEAICEEIISTRCNNIDDCVRVCILLF